MKAALREVRDAAPVQARTTRRVHVGEEFFAAAFASIVMEHVRPAPLPASRPVQSGGALPLASPSPLSSTSMLEAALADLCAAPPASPSADPSAARAAAPALPSSADVVASTLSETRIAIEHPELGTIRLSLSLDGNALLLSATTASRSAQTAVSLCAPALRASLSAQGLTLRSFDVSLSDSAENDSALPDPRARRSKRRGLDTEA